MAEGKPDFRRTMSIEDELVRSRDEAASLDQLLTELARPSFARILVHGSQREYTMTDLRQIIIDVRAGKRDLAEVPRADGWRKKVYGLLVLEQPERFLDAEEG